MRINDFSNHQTEMIIFDNLDKIDVTEPENYSIMNLQNPKIHYCCLE